jgi:hypothetical protein
MPEVPVAPQELFDLIHGQSDPAAFIRGLVDVNDPTFESDTLDFKSLPDPDPKDRKLKEIWAEALSGFANAGGGVLVLGIDARKTKLPGTDKEVDAARAVCPLPSPLHIASRLNELRHAALDRPLRNVRVEAYPRTPSPPGGGFVVCLIPEGSHKPYRVEMGDARGCHYLRAGDNTVLMPTSILQSLYHPRSKAVFGLRGELRYEVVPAAGPGRAARMTCRVELANEGTGSALEVVVRFHREAAPQGSVLTGSDNWRTWSQPHGRIVSSQSPDVPALELTRPLHPGFWVELGQVTWDAPATMSRGGPPREVPNGPNPKLSFSIFCADQERQLIECSFDLEQFLVPTLRVIRCEAKSEG